MGGRTVLDSRRAVIVWEPRRVVPTYAVPGADLLAEVRPADRPVAQEHPVPLPGAGPPVLDPRTPFAAHTCDGEPLTLVAAGVELPAAGFRPADPDLAELVVLDFAAFDEWLEEGEPLVGHPHDPFSRIDVLRSTSRVQVECDGVRLADTTEARLLFETGICTRFYLPRQDVRMDLLIPTGTRSTCAYKGHARYWSVDTGERVHRDLAWSYEEPLADARDVKDLVAFFDERVDVTVDGLPRPRPVTPWSRPRPQTRLSCGLIVAGVRQPSSAALSSALELRVELQPLHDADGQPEGRGQVDRRRHHPGRADDGGDRDEHLLGVLEGQPGVHRRPQVQQVGRGRRIDRGQRGQPDGHERRARPGRCVRSTPR